jgi:hypothetical protein
MLDPYPTGIKAVLDAQTKRLLGCLAAGEQAVEVANVCSILLKSDTSNERLAGFRFAHPSAAEALQRCVDSITNKRESAESVNPGGAAPQPVTRDRKAEPREPQLAAEESKAEPLERQSRLILQRCSKPMERRPRGRDA